MGIEILEMECEEDFPRYEGFFLSHEYEEKRHG